MEKLLLSRDEAVEMLSISKTLFKMQVASGAIMEVRIGRRTLYPVASLVAYVEKLTAR